MYTRYLYYSIGHRKETFYAFKSFSSRVFNFDLHKIKKVILWALLRELGKRCVWSVFASRAFANIPIIFQSSIKGNIYLRAWHLLIRQIFSHYCSKNRKADDKVQFLPFAVRIRKIFRNWGYCSFLDDKQKKIVTHVVIGRSDFYSGLLFTSEIRREPHWFANEPNQ